MYNDHVKIDWALFNLSELARRLKISQKYMHMIARGERRGPAARRIIRKVQAIIEKPVLN
ncbi:MAG: hypothetical protein HUU43_14175 [Ignavibacteriaceae bacterium]|nr:hypothetical protein [Ignavibacteriaceae bacterium]NUM71992.1 hypothetical protein [Ignavibacteriaceae bacterium]